MATNMEKSKGLHLFQIQTDDSVPATSVTGADFIEPTAESTIEPDVVVTEIDNASGTIDQVQAVIGRKKANSTLIFNLRNFGEKDSMLLPDWALVAQCAGFDLTMNNGYYILTPANDNTTAGTHWKYSGSLASLGSLISKAGNLKYDWKINLDFSGTSIATIEFTGVGRLDNTAPIDGTQPSVTKIRALVPPLRGVTMQIAGVAAYRPLSLEISGNPSTEATVLPSDTTGVGNASITNRKIKWSAKVYREKNSVANPESAMYAITEAVTSVLWDTSNKVQIVANYCQITNVKYSDENGVETWDLEGQCNRNDFRLRTLGASSSSSSSSS